MRNPVFDSMVLVAFIYFILRPKNLKRLYRFATGWQAESDSMVERLAAKLRLVGRRATLEMKLFNLRYCQRFPGTTRNFRGNSILDRSFQEFSEITNLVKTFGILYYETPFVARACGCARSWRQKTVFSYIYITFTYTIQGDLPTKSGLCEKKKPF